MTVHYNNRLQGRTVMVLPASCLHSVVVTIWGTAYTKSLPSTFLWADAWSQMTSAERRKKYALQSLVITLQPGKCPVSTGSYQGPAVRKSKSPPFPGYVGLSYE